MHYQSAIKLKDGRDCVLRNAGAEDAEEVIRIFDRTHEETDYLLSYPDESTLTKEGEEEFLKKLTESENAIELFALVDGVPVGLAGFSPVGDKEKVRHRADYGISILKEYWGLGIGRALTNACISCAKAAGYEQMELQVVAENKAAIRLYESLGFTEYGRNPKGFRSRITLWQELILMRLELK